MTKEKYMALADFQTLWTNSIKPYIVGAFLAMVAGSHAEAKYLVLADGSHIAQATFIAATEKGANSGVATLGSDGKVPTSQLPSFVDDVIDLLDIAATAPEHCATGDKYYNSDSKKIFTATGTDTWGETGADPEGGKIYITLDDNKTYRWSGTTMAEISAGLALGETQGTAYEGSKGAANAAAITALQSDKANKSEMAIEAVSGDSTKKTITLKNGTSQDVLVAHQDISGKQDEITASGILKGDGSGGVTAATAGTDYQTPLVAGTDYQTPLVAGTDYQTPITFNTAYNASTNKAATMADLPEVPERVSSSDLEGFIV